MTANGSGHPPTATQLVGEIASGEVTARALVDRALEIAEAWEPHVNAYVELIGDAAREQADRLDSEARSGRLRGPLHGVPIASKDNFLIEGLPARKGSWTTPDSPATATSPMTARLKAAGAIVIGRTTMPEHGWKGTGISPLTGVTRNPWDVRLGSGGSSAGSAVTVASGAVPIATGSDAGGSIRIPAAFCGVVGFKPTLGAIPVWPGTSNENLSHAGPLTRSVADARLVFDVTRGQYAGDPQSAFPPRQSRSLHSAPRAAIVGAPFECQPDPEVAARFDTAVQVLRDAEVADLVDTALHRELPRGIFEVLWVTGRGLAIRPFVDTFGERMDPGLARLASVVDDYTVSDYVEAQRQRREFNSWAFGLFEEWDFLVMPTMPLTAFDAEAEVPPGGDLDAVLPWITWTPYTYPFNISGQPAISLPIAPGDGMPTGLQIVARWGADDALLDFAERCERALAGLAVRHAPPLPM